MIRHAVQDVAAFYGRRIGDELADSAVDNVDLKATIVHGCLRPRSPQPRQGIANGPAVLVLWRGFTWTLEGSPKKNFKLSAKAILEREKNATRTSARPRRSILRADTICDRPARTAAAGRFDRQLVADVDRSLCDRRQRFNTPVGSDQLIAAEFAWVAAVDRIRLIGTSSLRQNRKLELLEKLKPADHAVSSSVLDVSARASSNAKTRVTSPAAADHKPRGR